MLKQQHYTLNKAQEHQKTFWLSNSAKNFTEEKLV